MPPPIIQGKHGALLLNAGGNGSVTNFAITVVHPPPAGMTDIELKGSRATWTATEVGRSPMPSASPNRYVLRIRATQTSTRRPYGPGDTDDITVTVTNSATPTDTDSSPTDGVFG
jgi:hypothetical protein